MSTNGNAKNGNPKDHDLAKVTSTDSGALTDNQGHPVGDDQNSLRAGPRGPTLLEDYILREKIQHFDHERIPERVVHARGAAAHGYFQVYESMAEYTTRCCTIHPRKRRYLYAFPPWLAHAVRPTPPAMCAALR